MRLKGWGLKRVLREEAFADSLQRWPHQRTIWTIDAFGGLLTAGHGRQVTSNSLELILPPLPRQQDLPNTTGSWDLYGQDDPKRYPSLQATFFNQAADVLTRREALRAFVALFGIGAIATFGYKGAADANLPITKTPAKTENGKGGTVRSRI